MNAHKRILIAGIGNIFFGDDAFGCEVAQQLALRQWPDGVQVRDFGIRGLDLAYALLESLDHVILVDAVPRGGPPGSLYVIEPSVAESNPDAPQPQELLDAHTMDPVKVLRLAKSLGAQIKSIILIGCEPTPLDPDGDLTGGLSQPVQAAISEAVQIVEQFVAHFTTAEDPVRFVSSGTLSDAAEPGSNHTLANVKE